MLSKKKCAAFAAILLAASSVFCACTQTKQDTATISNNETAAEKPEESVDEADAEKPEESADESDTAEYAEKVSFNTDVKDATKITAEANNAIYELLDFSDEQEREFAEKGFLSAPDSLVLKREDGTVVWSQDAYSFARDNDAPGSANPSLWRNTQLNALYGLFEVTDGIYQVRGYDVANLTFVRGEKGWIVFDCTTSIETAEAGLALFREKFSDAKISAVVISHAHIDHYGGIGGLVTQEELADSSLSLEEQADSGKTLLIVPEGFEKAVMEENVFAGNAMKRRSNYQYGSLLERGERGSLSVGIGLTTSGGTTSYLSPTYEVTDDIFEATVDGVDMVFQLTPGTESPAEMNTYLPGYKALWMAENCTGTMHNLYTLRGAEVRDANAWAQYIMEAKAQFGEEAEVVFQSHNWPHWGNDVINEYLLNTASVYKYIYSQTLQYLNEGYTSTEIANMISLPADLEKIWYTRQYYGTLEHNVKAVYQKYMGWYDANPIHLDELEPSEYAKKMVEYLGDTDDVLAKAKEDFEKVKAGGNLADTFKENKEEEKVMEDNSNKLQFYDEKEIRNIITNKEELYFADNGIDEVIIKFDDIPDFIVDINRKQGVVDLKFYKMGNNLYQPDITTMGEYLDKVKPEIREKIIDRLVKLQTGEIEPKEYKLIDENEFDDIKIEMEKEMSRKVKNKKKNREDR